MNVLVATIAVGPIAQVWDLARKTWEPYCRRHGYNLVVADRLPAPSLHPSWNKCLVVSEFLAKTRSPVWWVDCDMTVRNPDVPLETAVVSASEIIVSKDWNGYCFGLFRASPSAWAINFLRFVTLLGDIRNPDEFGKGLGVKWEQNAIKLLAREFPEVESRIKTLPPSWVNDNPHKPAPSDFILHFGGRSMEERIKMIHACHPAI